MWAGRCRDDNVVVLCFLSQSPVPDDDDDEQDDEEEAERVEEVEVEDHVKAGILIIWDNLSLKVC